MEMLVRIASAAVIIYIIVGRYILPHFRKPDDAAS
jgi:hypothetical protein